ncbi:MAG TPA: hypothetical protein GXX46_03510 [Peptococcaceae bacterium]|nr:hypothetical protein [Peptococcaceae bacterium]
MQNTTINRKYLFQIILIASLLFLLAVGLLGCGLFKKDSGQESSQEKQGEKIPKELEEIETKIESIFQILGGPVGEPQEKPSQQTKQDQEEPHASNQGQENPEEGSQGKEKASTQQNQSQDNASSQQVQKGQATKGDPWQQINLEIKDLHSGWNNFMPQATKKGATKEVIDGFSTALNDLTKIIAEKKTEQTLLAANRLYSQLPALYSLYKTKISPELKNMVYYTRNTVLASKMEDWGLAAKDMEEIKRSWAIMKNTIPEEQEDSISKLDLSIYELEKVIKEQNKALVTIKGELTLANISELQEAAQETGQKQ